MINLFQNRLTVDSNLSKKQTVDTYACVIRNHGFLLQGRCELVRIQSHFNAPADDVDSAVALREVDQGFLQLQAWVSTNGVLKDCMTKVYLVYGILMKY